MHVRLFFSDSDRSNEIYDLLLGIISTYIPPNINSDNLTNVAEGNKYYRGESEKAVG